MRMLGNSTQGLPSTKPVCGAGNGCDEEPERPTGGLPQGSKLKMSIEKKIENIWLESQQLGWDYNDFVSHLIEVVIVLNYRSFHAKLNANQKSEATPI